MHVLNLRFMSAGAAAFFGGLFIGWLVINQPAARPDQAIAAPLAPVSGVVASPPKAVKPDKSIEVKDAPPPAEKAPAQDIPAPTPPKSEAPQPAPKAAEKPAEKPTERAAIPEPTVEPQPSAPEVQPTRKQPKKLVLRVPDLAKIFGGLADDDDDD